MNKNQKYIEICEKAKRLRRDLGILNYEPVRIKKEVRKKYECIDGEIFEIRDNGKLIPYKY